uniref:Transgelin n=2 Tax=Magallana gigas TaxID=29159 RepID=A0A8W8LEQ3_MAGGI
MAERMKPMGMDRALSSKAELKAELKWAMTIMKAKMGAKYDPQAEAEVRHWFKQLLNEDIGEGSMTVEKNLKDGILLIKLLQKLYEGTPNKPAACDKIKLKFNTSQAPFKQMENIELFLKGANAYGVPDNSLFQTVDLYEGRNMAMVIATILQVGTEAQRYNFNGPTCGSKPVEKHQVEFSYEQLKQSHGVIGLQSGTNKFATQKGMRIGAVRHIADIRADDLSQDGQNHIGLQAGSNQFASQKGMTGFGAVRHISDIRADQYDKESNAHISLQSGTNKFDSQKGMRGGFGAVRHISDIRADQYSEESKTHISLQSGTNQFASQKGMTGFGAVRHIADIRADDLDREAAAEVSLQYGTNRFDSQKGMTSFGAQRHVSDIKVNDLAEDMRRKMGYTPSVQDMQEYPEQDQ